MQDRILNICNLLPTVPNSINFGGVAHDNQQHDMLKYLLSTEIPFKSTISSHSLFCSGWSTQHSRRLNVRVIGSRENRLLFFLLSRALRSTSFRTTSTSTRRHTTGFRFHVNILAGDFPKQHLLNHVFGLRKLSYVLSSFSCRPTLRMTCSNPKRKA